MSEDGFSDNSDEPNMEIQIETLMGNSFDLRVSATDTVKDLKKRINRVEGISMNQQNLLYQNKELQDTRRLSDIGIKDGSKLKLVLSMRGGPISTRRITTGCEHQLILKELKEFLDTTRDDIDDKLSPGSKISVLVFKEGDIINLLRVIENEDGSYVPYNEKPISPPKNSNNKTENRGVFEKVLEDHKMNSNIKNLRKKMEDVTARKKKLKNKDSQTEPGTTNDDFTNFLSENCSFKIPDLSFKLMGNYKTDLKIYEHKEINEKDEGNQSECEEIALKDKHRSKQIWCPRSRSSTTSNKSHYSETKGSHSYTKHTYARIHKKNREFNKNLTETDNDEILNSPIDIDKTTVTPTLLEEMTTTTVSNRLHVARLVLSDNTERPKSTESIEVEENPSELWSIHETTQQSATYKLGGLLKRRQSLNYSLDETTTTSKVSQDFNSNYELCSSSSNFLMASSPSAIPPQYAPKNHDIVHDYYYRNRPRSPLYGRKSSRDSIKNLDELNKYSKLPNIKSDTTAVTGGCISIGDERLKNDKKDIFLDNEKTINDLCNYYNLGNAGDFLGETKSIDVKNELAPVNKKRARCNFCNRKLNITNIYNCRCGKIFCSQHRYSEVHHCNYDYKTDGRRFLEQQNPLVTADKINRF